MALCGAFSAGDAETAAKQETERRERDMEAARLKTRGNESDQDDDEDTEPDNKDVNEPVAEIVCGVRTHKCRTLEGLLNELGNFTSCEGQSDSSGFQIALQGLNVVIYYEESLNVKSPLHEDEADAFSNGPFVISPFHGEDSDDDVDCDAEKQLPRSRILPEMPPWLAEVMDANKCTLDNPANMQADSFKVELPPKVKGDGSAGLKSMADYVAASFTAFGSSAVSTR